MNSDLVEGNWQQFSGMIQDRYGHGKDQVTMDVDEFFGSI